jgi:hypothetical protein
LDSGRSRVIRKIGLKKSENDTFLVWIPLPKSQIMVKPLPLKKFLDLLLSVIFHSLAYL